jgi:hypothetical protein
MRASEPQLGSPQDARGRALSRSESGLARPNFLSSSVDNLGSAHASSSGLSSPAESPVNRRNTRQALMLKKDEKDTLPTALATPRRGKVVLQDDVNIWDEGADGPHNLLVERQADPNSITISGGTFNKLVEKLTTPLIDNQGAGGRATTRR